jgi:hypothetical protein
MNYLIMFSFFFLELLSIRKFGIVFFYKYCWIETIDETGRNPHSCVDLVKGTISSIYNLSLIILNQKRKKTQSSVTSSFVYNRYRFLQVSTAETVTGQGCPDALTPCPALQDRAGRKFLPWSCPALPCRAGQGKIFCPDHFFR